MSFANNGRINILGPIGPQFQFADKIPVKQCVSYREALTGQWNDSYLSLAQRRKEFHS